MPKLNKNLKKFEKDTNTNLIDHFEGCTKKRKIELDHVEKIKEFLKIYKRIGNIITLTGPAVTTHILQYLGILDKKSKLIIAEFDNYLIKKYDYENQIQQFNDTRISLFKGDVWDAIEENYKSKRNSNFILFDFDYCVNSNHLIKNNFLDRIDKLASSHLPNKRGFFLSLTVCDRKDPEDNWERLSAWIKKSFEENGYKRTIYGEEHYRK